MRDIDKIIEMALDFNEFNVDDPHDPEFHKAIAGQLVVAYYPATTAEFWGIIHNGINVKPTIKREQWRENEIFFDTTPANDMAQYKAYQANGENSEGPIKPMIIAVQVKFQKPHKVGKGEMDQFMGTAMGAEANTILPLHIKPSQILGVVYPSASNQWETPIKAFLEKAQSGMIDGLEPDDTFKRSKYRPQGPTEESWQHAVIRYCNDLLNYSSILFDYLLGREKKHMNDIVIRESTKLGLQRMLNWTGVDFMKWLYQILPHETEEMSVEDDIRQVMQNAKHEGWDRPFYQLFKKYTDSTTYKYRSGQEEPPPPWG